MADQRSQDDGMPPSEARELKQLRDENSKLKRLVAAIRHQLAGQSNACEIPPPEIRARLI